VQKQAVMTFNILYTSENSQFSITISIPQQKLIYFSKNNKDK